MENNLSEWKMVIGLEVHVQLNTRTKMFTSSEWGYGESPNTQTCPVTLGYPGTLPTINSLAVKKGISIGLSLNCEINKVTKFARKHYFYPDLPKGYQISQFHDPLCENGYIELLNHDNKKINIVRAHLEEDAGKTIHSLEGNALIDYNRAGAPLLEIVSGPDISSAAEAIDYLNSLKEIIIELNASDCDMEKGNLRVDLNISVMKKDSKQLGIRREVKNVNSFRNVEKAIKYEFGYQTDALNDGGQIYQETLLWDDNDMTTKSIRSKEDAKDYRYFPEPDLPPLIIKQELIDEVRESIPELPDSIRDRFEKLYSLDKDKTNYLIQNKSLKKYFELMCQDDSKNSIKYYNWLTIDVVMYLKNNNIDINNFPISPINLKELVDIVVDGKLDHSKAKEVFSEMLKTNKKCADVIIELGYDKKQNIDDVELFIRTVLSKHPSELERLESGETKLINFFVGVMMRESKGKYPANVVMDFLNKEFNS